MTDTPLERRLRMLYADPVPTELDRRIITSLTTVPIPRSGPSRRRVLGALAVAAIVAASAAGPLLEWFGGADDPFAQLWESSTPVDQSVTADGYRVTAHRAHADVLGVRLALTVEDLEDRWSSLEVDGAEMTDADGRIFEGWNWSGSRTPVDGAIATWARFLLPDDVRDGDRRLQVKVTSLRVRAPDPVPFDPDEIFTSVRGTWSFEFDMPPIAEGFAISPAATASSHGVMVRLVELGVVPSGTVVRLAVEGLPELPANATAGWKPVANIEHDGVTLDEWELPPGVPGSSDGVVTIEALPVLDDLAGHWRISIVSFWSTGQGTFGGDLGGGQGPWVLEFDVPVTP
jgi:hypothetical protein